MRAISLILARILYGVFAVIFLVAGASSLLFNTGILPATLKNFVEEESQGDLQTLHIMQETASLLLLVGALLCWQLRRDEVSLFFHWSMTAFWALIALVHWVDVRGPWTSAAGPLFTSIPFVLFALVGLIIPARRPTFPPQGEST